MVGTTTHPVLAGNRFQPPTALQWVGVGWMDGMRLNNQLSLSRELHSVALSKPKT